MDWPPPHFLLAVLLLVLGTPAPAHHSFPAEFDKSSPGELKGTIVGVWYKNPHARYRMEVITEDRTMTIHDPYYSKPLVRQRGSARRDSLVVFEPAPCDSDGHFRDLLETGRLEDHLAQ